MHIKKLNLNNAPFIWALQKKKQNAQKPSISFSQMLKRKKKGGGGKKVFQRTE